MTRSSVASEVRSVVSSSQLPEAPPLGATLLIIDPGVPDYTRIMAAATPGTEVYLLDDQADSITQITEILAGRRNIHSLHILSHGSPNYLHFSGGEVGLHNIRTYAHLWPTWKNALTPESNILLYGCQVAAQTSEALSLVAHIAEQTGAKVAASSRPTGNAALGGDWQMDISTGPITAYPALQPFLLVTYPHLLGEAFFKLSDFTLPTYDSSPHHFTNLNDTLYFTAINPITGYELWRSDGTAAGTVLVKDLLPGSTSSELNNFTNLSGTLYFTAIHPTNGYELWRSDGTEAGTVLFKDIAPGRSSSYFNEFTNFNGALFFTAYNPTTGEELWKSDGTEVGTVIVRDIAPGYSGSDPRNFNNLNGTLFFTANDGIHGRELWRSDGTTAGTVLVTDISPGRSGSNPNNFTNFNGTHFFTADDGIHGRELWRSDGTAAGAVLVKDISSGNSGSNPNNFTDFNGTLFFTANDGIHGRELWKSDGTTAGTVLVKDISSGSSGSGPNNFTNLNGTLFFKANDGLHGYELWRSDGTEAGTVMIEDIYWGENDFLLPGNLTIVGNIGYFVAYDITNGYGLWKSDGTPAGTMLVKDALPGNCDTSSPDGFFVIGAPFNNLTDVNGTLFFTAYDPTNGYELWKSDGTTAGTVLVKDIAPGSSRSNPSNFTNVNGTLFFTVYNPTTGDELWKSDGTTAGTILVKDTAPSRSHLSLGNFANINGTLFFTADNSTTGDGLWKSDGTTAGTVLVKDIAPGRRNFFFNNFTNLNGTLYFTAYNSTTGDELWKSDGTTAGTVLVKDIYLGYDSSAFDYITNYFPMININGTLFFTAHDPTIGRELWKSDGTTAGTVLVKDIHPGINRPTQSTSSNPLNLTNVNGTLFFTTGNELWKSDGTTAGTVLVKDISIGRSSSSPKNLVNVNGTLYFTADDGIHGTELWRSDGTEAGTVMVQDFYAGRLGSNPSNLVVSATNSLFFFADDGVNGVELHTMVIDTPPEPIQTEIIPLENQLLSVVGGSPTRLTATVTTQGADSVFDVAVVWVDDAEGRVDGLLPSASGYAAAALGRATTLLSVLKAGEFAGQFGRRSLAIAPGQFLQFALVQGGTLDDLRRGGAGQLLFAMAAANANGQSAVQFNATVNPLTMTLSLPGSSVPSVALQLGLDPTPAPVGCQQQGIAPQSEILDLTGLSTPTATLTLEVFREASFNNVVGFYTVEDSQGRVRDSLTGNLINPGEAGYLQAALANQVASVAGQNGRTLPYTANAATGQLLSSFLVVDSTLEILLDRNPGNDPTVFFNHIAANGDGQDHVRLLGDNVFGYEDITGGGDRDFNDVIVKVSVAQT